MLFASVDTNKHYTRSKYMAIFRRNTEQQAAEAALLRALYSTAIAAADAYAVARERAGEQDLAALFDKLRSDHLRYASDLKKRVARLGADPEARTGLIEAGGRVFAVLHAAGTERDVLTGMRAGEEQGVVLCRETLQHAELSRKNKDLVAAYQETHLNAVKTLSEQIALRGGTLPNSIQYYLPAWARYPQPGFWIAQGALVALGYWLGRRK
jgi:hypothetical protein